MKAFLARSPIGIFAFSEDGQLLCYKLPSSAEEGIRFLKSGQNPLKEELSGYDVQEDESSYRIFRKKFREFARLFGDERKVNEFLNDFGRKYSMSFMLAAVTRDKLLIQASNALEDLKKITNIYQERLWEWFSLHYPEANRRDLLDNVVKYGNRKNFPGFAASLGIELSEEDEKILRSYAAMIKSALEEKKRLEKYITETTKEIMPNFSLLIDPLLASRFLSLAGSLERLARMPASTIQLLGAEKSLFRHLKQQGKSPKYGILFQDGRIQSAADSKRGKIARIISSKLMLAARIDFYSQRLEEKLKVDLEKELKSL
jgi:RNA processing factor Prp31